MSYFPNMLKSTKDITTYLLHVTPHGDMAIYRLDDHGNGLEMVVGGAREVLEVPLKQANSDLRIINLDLRWREKNYKQGPRIFGIPEDTWAKAVKMLNGHSRTSGWERHHLYTLTSNGVIIKQCDMSNAGYAYGKIEITEEGIQEDEQINREAEKENT